MIDLEAIHERAAATHGLIAGHRAIASYDSGVGEIADAYEDREILLAAIDAVRAKAAALRELHDMHARVGSWTDKDAFQAFNARYTEASNAAFAALEHLIGKEEVDVLYEAQSHCKQCEERGRAGDDDS